MRCMCLTGVIGGIWLCGSAAGVPEFTDVTFQQGLEDFEAMEGQISGVAAADYDADGDIDIFLPTGSPLPNRLYENDGAGNFVDVAADVGLDSTLSARAALFFDSNNDGRLDLVIARDCHSDQPACDVPGFKTLNFYEQQADGTFEDVSAQAGLDLDLSVGFAGTHAGAFAAGDLDNDGFLDLIYTQWNATSYVFKNNGDGSFTDVGVESGIVNPDVEVDHWQPLVFDFNGDGLQDIFIAVDFGPDQFWINQGGMEFVNIADEADTNIPWNGMGVAIGDIENDGDFDIYVTNISVGKGAFEKYSTLYRNESTGNGLFFVESAKDLDVDAAGWGWGAGFVDGDLDGRVDLAATNGRFGGFWEDDASVYFQNKLETEGGFENINEEVGFDDTDVGSTVVFADIDRDGDSDLIQTCTVGEPRLRLLENDAAQQAGATWLAVRPRMQGANIHAIGALVQIRAGKAWQRRAVLAGTSLAGQEPAEAMFGLAGAQQADELLIEWPGGLVTYRESVAGGRIHDITAPTCAADIDASGEIDTADLFAVLTRFGDEDIVGDLDGNGTVDSIDLNEVLGRYGAPCGG